MVSLRSQEALAEHPNFRLLRLSSPKVSKIWVLETMIVPPRSLLFRTSFDARIEGCHSAKEELHNEISYVTIHDYYSGNMFARKRGEKLLKWNENGAEVFLFLTALTDKLECARNRKEEAVSLWPIIASVLNFRPDVRSRASHSMVLVVFPVSHHADYFDTFIHDIVHDIERL